MNEIVRSAEFRAVASADGENDGRTLEGYVAVFNQDTEINSWEGRFTERIARGAFKKTLEGGFPVMQFNHGREIPYPIGVYRDMKETPKGVYAKGQIFKNAAVEPIREAIAEGAVSGMSFRFRVIRDIWHDNTGRVVKGDELHRLIFEPGERGPLVRTLKEVQMSEAGPVVFPAYAGTSVGLRSLENMTEEDRQGLIEEYRRTMIEEEDRDSRIADLIAEGYTPESVERAVEEDDMDLLDDDERALSTGSVPGKMKSKKKDDEDDEDSKKKGKLPDDDEKPDDEPDGDKKAPHYPNPPAKDDGKKGEVKPGDEQPDDEKGGGAKQKSKGDHLPDDEDPKKKKKRSDDPEKPYGDVTYADPGYQKDGKKRYPIDTKDHVKAAWSYINMPKNQSAYTPDQVSKIKARIKSAAKKLGIEISGDEKKSSDVLDDAAREGTSPANGNPEDAAQEGTSIREQGKEKSVERNAPEETRTRAMTLDELRTRNAEISVRLEDMAEEYRDAELPEELQGEYDDLRSEFDKNKKSIDRIVKRAEELKDVVARGGEGRTVSGDSRSETREDRRAASFHKDKGDDIYDVDAIRSESYSVEDYQARLRDHAIRSIEKGKFASITSRESAQERASELLEHDDEYGTLAKRMLVAGSPVYERAFAKAARSLSLGGLTAEEQRAMALASDPKGGYAVPVTLDPTVILTNDGFVGEIRSLARVETIIGKEWQGVTTTGINVSRDGTLASADYTTPGSEVAGEIGRVNEATEAPDSSPILKQPTIRVTRVHGFIPFSIEIDQDWGSLRSEMTRLLTEAKAREEMESFTLGTGSGLQPGGVVGSLPAASRVAAAGEGLTVADIYKLKNALPPRWRANAAFMASADVYDLIRAFDTTGGASFWTDLNTGRPPKLIGYPVHENSYMDEGAFNELATATHDVAVFGDFKQFLIVDRVGMNVELVPHLFGTANNFPTGQRGLYAIWRNNAKVLVPEAFRVLRVSTSAA